MKKMLSTICNKRSLSKLFFTAMILCTSHSTVLHAKPLIQFNNLIYDGAYRFPINTYGDSRLPYTHGTFAIDTQKKSIFIVGHSHHQAIAEFLLPEPVNSAILSDIKIAPPPVQPFTQIFDRAPTGNDESIDRISGIEIIEGKLIVNAVQFYDAGADNSDTTLVIENASDLSDSLINGFYKLEGAVHAAGWLTTIPSDWVEALESEYISGFASNYAINGRNSIGPTAFLLNPANFSTSTPYQTKIPSTPLLDFSLNAPLHFDRYNNEGENDLWTEISTAVYGFIVPGTSTYLTIGTSGGHDSGIGYKITQTDGHLCGGPCPYSHLDSYNYLWFWDVNDLLKAKQGLILPSEIRPYLYGQFQTPFQKEGEKYNPIVGADFDASTGTLFILLRGGDSLQSPYEEGPILLRYKLGLQLPKPPSALTITNQN